MKHIKNMKIHNKLLLSYILACILPFLLISQLIYQYSVANLESTLLEMMTIFNSQIVTNIDDFITEYDNITKTILVDKDIVTQINIRPNSSISEKTSNQLAARKVLMRLETLRPDIGRVILLTDKDEIFQYGKISDSVDQRLLQEERWFQNLTVSPKTLECYHNSLVTALTIW